MNKRANAVLLSLFLMVMMFFHSAIKTEAVNVLPFTSALDYSLSAN